MPDRNSDHDLVRVYKNLNKKCFSVQKKGDRGWRLWAHVDSICLDDVQFKVYEAGRIKVLETGRKNVHAYVIGRINHDKSASDSIGNMLRVSYDPKLFSQFIYSSTQLHIYNADNVIIRMDGIYVGR